MEQKSNAIMIVLGIAAVVSVAAGIFIIMNPVTLSKSQEVLIGIISIIAGIILAGTTKRSWTAVFGLIIFGMYQLGRASGKIENQFFRYIAGLPLVVIGLYAIYKIIEVIFPDSEENI